MAIKSLNEIILDFIEFYKSSLPDLDTKAGTVARDLMIDAPASQIALIYNEISAISDLQSLRLVSGSDLEKLGQNLGATKKAATSSTGIALITFSSIPANIAINSGDIVTAQNGQTFSIINGLTVDASRSNYYRSIATKYQNDLDFLGITDQYAVEVSVRATVPGLSGNISKYSLISTSIPGTSNVTNVFAFQGGSNQEDDTSFRNRVLAIFSGSNIGTALGYRNTALTNPAVQDALVISPGDVLMTRDGTVVETSEDGTKTIISEGSGGKIDVIILGNSINQNIDTFIYRDKSNSNDPTNEENDVILGQIPGDENKTVTRKRIDNIADGILPSQPIEQITEVTATLSGGNFLPKSVDSLGRVSGNYELIKDTGVYAGSPWSRDRFHWISDRISDFPEDLIKGQLNGQDSTSFTDVIEIPKIQQSISINNENSLINNSDRSIVNLLHTPCSTVSRVLNTNTGERYTIVNQNLDGGSPFNNTGRIKISGNTLPSSSDILQVDYTWIIDYDCFSDYDGKILNNNLRSSIDSVDWGTANSIKSEKSIFELNNNSTFYTGNVSLPISSVISASSFKTNTGKVESSSVVNFSDRLAISLLSLNDQIDNILSIKISGTEEEVYDTASGDGLFLNNRVVVGTEIKYNTSIILPTDTKAQIGDYVDITYNLLDIFNITDSVGSFINKQITIPSANVEDGYSQINVLVDYITSSQELLSYGITNLPISREGNGFILNNNIGSKNSIISNCISRQNQTVQKDNSNNFYIKLNLLSTEYLLNSSDIITVINIFSGLEFWNNDGYGSITIDSDLNYVLNFSGLNSPAVGDQVMVVFNVQDINRSQPFTFKNEIIKYNLQSLDFNFTTNNFYCQLNNFGIETSLSFDIKDFIDDITIAAANDGYISNIENDLITFASSSYNFANLSEINNKYISISTSSNINNNGKYKILELIDNNTIMMSPLTENISDNQISIIRLSDNKDLWDVDNSSISSNILNLSTSTQATAGDKVLVIIFGNQVLRKSPTRLSVTLTDQLINSGTLTINGTTITKVSDIVFTATQNGFKQNISEALKNFLGVSSISSISENISLVRLLKLEKVITTTDDEVISSVINYDVFGTEIYNNLLYSNEMNNDLLLSKLEFRIPDTTSNLSEEPKIGDKLRISFTYSTSNDSENLYFTRNGTLYTNKKFAIVNKIFVSSGFNSSQSARFIVSFLTQPSTGSRYKVYYDYLAPKQNERILITTNFNQAITDTTFAIEASRPINADVLVRSAKEILVDATINIVVKQEFLASAAIVKQNVKDRITTTINTEKLGDTIDSSDIVAAVQGVDGVDRVRVIYFNKNGEVGSKLTLIASRDEYFVSNNIIVNQENR